MSKWTWIFLIFTVTVVLVAAGIIYWTTIRNNSAFNISSTKSASPKISASSTPKASLSQIKTNNITMPTDSVEGKDIPNVTPFVGSIRSLYQETDPNNISAEYYAKAKPSEVLDYFKTKLAENGWVLRAEDQNILSFTLDNATVAIEIGEQDANKNLVVYRINYLVEETPPEESPISETT